MEVRQEFDCIGPGQFGCTDPGLNLASARGALAPGITMQTEPQTDRALEEVRDKLSLVEVAMVAYQAPSGELHSEPLQTARMDKEGNLWFFISINHALVTAVAGNPHVNLIYVNDKEGIYLSVGGTAKVLRNRDLQEALWNGKLKRWLPHGPGGENTCLFKVAVGYCEYWDEPKSNLFRMLLKAVDAAEGEDIGLAHRQISVGSTNADQ